MTMLMGLNLEGMVLLDYPSCLITKRATSFVAVDGTTRYQTSQLINGGINLTLAGSESYGWIQRNILDILVDIVNDDESGDLIYGGETYVVRFRLEDPPVLEFTPLFLYGTPSPMDYFFGTIKLITTRIV